MTSNNIRALIDTVEEDDKSRAELEQIIINLRNKIKELNDKIVEQENKISDQEKRLSQRFRDLPENIKVLKEVIVTQRQEISEKDASIEVMRELVEKFTNELEDITINKETEFELTDIPGVGFKLAELLYNAGINSIIDLINCDVEKISKEITGIGLKRIRKWQNFLLNRAKNLRLNYYKSK